METGAVIGIVIAAAGSSLRLQQLNDNIFQSPKTSGGSVSHSGSTASGLGLGLGPFYIAVCANLCCFVTFMWVYLNRTEQNKVCSYYNHRLAPTLIASHNANARQPNFRIVLVPHQPALKVMDPHPTVGATAAAKHIVAFRDNCQVFDAVSVTRVEFLD
jgi:hypothetical protein